MKRFFFRLRGDKVELSGMVLFGAICSNAVLTPSRTAPPRDRCMPSCLVGAWNLLLPLTGREMVTKRKASTMHHGAAIVFAIAASQHIIL